MEYTTLNEFLNILCSDKKMHLCINITSDLFLTPALQLEIKYREHTKSFCYLAKATRKGYELCVNCKGLTIAKAMRTGKSFAGYCPFGIYEFVKPVIINGKVVCIIYVGNMIIDYEETMRKLTHACKLTQVSRHKLLEELENCKNEKDIAGAKAMAKLVDTYIKLLVDYADLKKYKPASYSYRISEMREYIWRNHTQNITLKQLAKNYYVNEKYLGRLFKKEMGMSVHEYLNETRLKRASALLSSSTNSILDISIECGFANISHFNRSFKKYYGITPSEYRSKSGNK